MRGNFCFLSVPFLHWVNCEVEVDNSCDEILAEMECYLSVPFFNSFVFHWGKYFTFRQLFLPSFSSFFSVLVISKSCNKKFCVSAIISYICSVSVGVNMNHNLFSCGGHFWRIVRVVCIFGSQYVYVFVCFVHCWLAGK